jgi:hypothetical protein
LKSELFLLQAENPIEQEDWISSLKKAIKKYSSVILED